MTFEVTELKLAGIDERNLNTIHEYEEYVKNCLPASEVINLDSRQLITMREGLPPNHHTAVFVVQGSHLPEEICPAVRSIQ
ncbi:MAG: hypothetical protein PHT99_07840 [Methanoregula sp.]|nr:hypothetical protein [Methanoregula sp.]